MHSGAGRRMQGDSAGGSSFCGPIALHSRRNSFLRTDLLGRTVCAGCAPPSSAAFGSLAWPVIVKIGSTPYGGESRPGTKRFMVHGAIFDTAPSRVSIPLSLSLPLTRSLVVARCVGVLRSIDYGISRGTRRLMAYYYRLRRRKKSDEVVEDRYCRVISGVGSEEESASPIAPRTDKLGRGMLYSNRNCPLTGNSPASLSLSLSNRQFCRCLQSRSQRGNSLIVKRRLLLDRALCEEKRREGEVSGFSGGETRLTRWNLWRFMLLLDFS